MNIENIVGQPLNQLVCNMDNLRYDVRHTM